MAAAMTSLPALRSPCAEELSDVALARFGVRAFRPGQRELIDAVLQGSDALGVLPTGGGKSLTCQLPALVLGRPTVVVSPLIALMKDQCDHMERIGLRPAELDSTLTRQEEHDAVLEIRHGEHPLIYVTPERLATDACIAMLEACGVGLIAVDEAHCVSQWGHDFRPAFLRIRDAAAKLGRPPMLALTATATEETTRDIVAELGLRSPRIMRTSVVRENLIFSVVRTPTEISKRVALTQLLDAERGNAGIVYAATVRKVNELYEWLASMRVPVARYHGKMCAEDRERSRERFMRGDVEVMVATNAFGLGIDNADLRFVAHYQFPGSVEAYYQEAGRAGRDGRRARCALFYQLEDARVHRYFIARRIASARAMAARGVCPVASVQALGSRERARLRDVMHYGQGTRCRSQTLASYFGETTSMCGVCDRCASHRSSYGTIRS